jgi:hypothetical protein
MPIPASESELAALFARLGASEPESWARSQVLEGIPQLLRYLFLKAAWRNVESDDDTSWMRSEVDRANARPEEPYAGLGLGLDQCLRQGVDPVVLNEMIRCAQATMIFRIGYLLDGGDSGGLEELRDVSWALFETDADGRPTGPAIGGLHESVLELDPAGREMRAPEALRAIASRNEASDAAPS